MQSSADPCRADGQEHLMQSLAADYTPFSDTLPIHSPSLDNTTSSYLSPQDYILTDGAANSSASLQQDSLRFDIFADQSMFPSYNPNPFPSFYSDLQNFPFLDDYSPVLQNSEQSHPAKRTCFGFEELKMLPVRFYSPERTVPPPGKAARVKDARYIPEDILYEIFFHALRVSDEHFRCDVAHSPFGRQPSSAVNILLVCKQWYRMGHPHLYECLVFRNMFQIQCFHNMLLWYKKGRAEYQTTKATRLKMGIRRVRLEVCFGSLLSKVLNTLDNTRIDALFIAFPQWYDKARGVAGVINTIKVLRPQHMIIDWKVTYAESYANFIAALNDSAANWRQRSTLEVHLPSAFPSEMSCLMNSFSEDAALSLILRYRGSNIEKLIPFIWQCKDDDRICSTELFIDAPQREMLLALKEVGKHMPVLPQTLKVSTPYWHSNLFVTNLRRSSSAGNPTPKDQPRLPVRALLRVIDFALDDLGPMKCKWDVEEYVDLCGKFRSLYSSKELKKYCTYKSFQVVYAKNLQLLYTLAEHDAFRIRILDFRLNIRPVKQLILDSEWYKSDNFVSLFTAEVDSLLQALLQTVQILQMPLLPFHYFTAPAEANYRLHTLSLELREAVDVVEDFTVSQESAFPDVRKVFRNFPNVKKLTLSGFSSPPENYTFPRPKSYFEQSSLLGLDFDGTKEALDFVIKCRFTSVRSLRYRGSKGLPLRLPWTTILYHFPNLRKLHFPVDHREMHFDSLEQNQTIEIIVLCRPCILKPSSLADIFNIIDFGLFNALKEVHLDFFDEEWPWQECELKKDIRWATLAARAMQKYDIHFKNNSGVAWKPRMHERPRCLEQPVQLQRTRKRKRGCIDP